MKKFIAAVMACLIICAVFAGCSDPLKENNSSSSTSSQTKEAETETETETETATEEKTYKNSLDGLCEYLTDEGFLTGKTDISKNAEEIGAKESRFYNGKKGNVELYYYTDAIPENVSASVEKDNTVTLYGKTVKNVYITESNKYLMIYNDSAASDTGSENYKIMSACIKAFNKFESVADETSDDSKKSEKAEEETEAATEAAEKETKAE